MRIILKSLKGRVFGGNALIVTVIIALVISFVSASLILLIYYNRNAWRQSVIEEKLDRNLRSGVNLVLADTADHFSESKTECSLFQQGDDSVGIERRPWGIYGMASVSARYYSRSEKKIFLYGSLFPNWLGGCLYLVDHQRSLGLVGNAVLRGDAWLPRMGLKQVYIDQRGFAGDSLIAGHIFTSEKTPPPLDSAALAYLYAITDTGRSSRDSTLTFSTLGDTLFRSFDDALLELRASGLLEIAHTKITGQCLIRSDSLIQLDSDAVVTNAILAAPVIRVKSGFSGTLQLIATDSIILEDNCHLAYPSALVLLRHTQPSFQGEIRMGKDCSLDGVLLSLSQEKNDNNPKTAVTIGQGSVVDGMVFINGFLTLQGSVYGTLLTDYFLYRNDVSVLMDVMVDAAIDRSRLSSFYVGPLLFLEKKPKRIIQWLD